MSDQTGTTDGDLWRQAREGDAESFGVLFDRHGERVRSYCARRTGSVDEADDLVAIVFLEAWRRRDEVDLVADSALPWLYGVARHTVLHRRRAVQRHRSALSRLPQATVTADHADEVASRLDDARRLARVREALSRLGRTDQDVLLLCVWQGLDYASAAVALGVPVGTVRSRLARARARLAAAADDLPSGAGQDPDPTAPARRPVPAGTPLEAS